MKLKDFTTDKRLRICATRTATDKNRFLINTSEDYTLFFKCLILEILKRELIDKNNGVVCYLLDNLDNNAIGVENDFDYFLNMDVDYYLENLDNILEFSFSNSGTSIKFIDDNAMIDNFSSVEAPLINGDLLSGRYLDYKVEIEYSDVSIGYLEIKTKY